MTAAPASPDGAATPHGELVEPRQAQGEDNPHGELVEPRQAQAEDVQKSANSRLIQAVQMRRRQVEGLADEEVWRPYLFHLTGVESLRAMNGRQLGIVLDDLTAKERPTAGKVKKPNRWRTACPQAKKVLSLWLDLYRAGKVRSKQDKAIDAFVKRQTGLDSAQWLSDPADAASVIEALKAWQRRPLRQAQGEEEADD